MPRPATCSGSSTPTRWCLPLSCFRPGCWVAGTGRRKVLLISLVLFGVASVACAYSASAGALIAARALLGLGAAAIVPLSLSVLPVLFTPQERPRAIAAVTGAVFVSYPVGPI